MATGIICEYNPFHKGHLYQLCSTAAQTAGAPIICVMSGHYVQRAEPAILDKWTRTRMALSAGAAIVIELPTYYSTATAEWFAYGALSLLRHTGLVTSLSFGIESPAALPILRRLAAQLVPESPAYRQLLQSFLSEAPSYAAARSLALEALAGEPVLLQTPNAILALEYLKSLRKLDWDLPLLPIARSGSGYHDLAVDTAYPSASAIRRQAAAGRPIQPYLPDCCQAFLPAPYVWPKDLFAPLRYCLSFHDAASLRQIDEVSEGLENRILAAARDYPDFDRLLLALKTKRYPTSRLRRILLNLLLHITKERKDELNFSAGPAYIRVLGFRKDQEALVSQLTASASLPVITNLPRQLPNLPPRAQAMLRDELRFSEIYGAARPGFVRDQEYRQPLIVYPSRS